MIHLNNYKHIYIYTHVYAYISINISMHMVLLSKQPLSFFRIALIVSWAERTTPCVEFHTQRGYPNQPNPSRLGLLAGDVLGHLCASCVLQQCFWDRKVQIDVRSRKFAQDHSPKITCKAEPLAKRVEQEGFRVHLNDFYL